MSAPAAESIAAEINRLHNEVNRNAEESNKRLHASAVAAWQAGKLLIEERKHVRETMGAAWGLWLERHFQGTPRTARNYMLLAHNIDDVALLEGLSLRQVYLRLGISTQPKSRGKPVPVAALPSHVRLANRLLATLDPRVYSAKATRKQREAYRMDLRALYDRLQTLFESEFEA